MEKLIKQLEAKAAELRLSSETEVCSSIRIESKDMLRGFGIALQMIKLHLKSCDYITHHDDFVAACEIAMRSADTQDDSDYWKHQIDTLNNLK